DCPFQTCSGPLLLPQVKQDSSELHVSPGGTWMVLDRLLQKRQRFRHSALTEQEGSVVNARIVVRPLRAPVQANGLAKVAFGFVRYPERREVERSASMNPRQRVFRRRP